MGDAFDNMLEMGTDAMERAMERTAQESVAVIQESIFDPYPPASLPGNPPHRRTGGLHRGVSMEVQGRNPATEITATIRSERVEGDPRVPEWLEHGTDKMEARMFMRPEANRLRGSLPRAVASATELKPN